MTTAGSTQSATEQQIATKLAADEPLVFGMVTDPKPQQAIVNLDGQRPVAKANTDRTKSPNLLEMQ